MPRRGAGDTVKDLSIEIKDKHSDAVITPLANMSDRSKCYGS